MQTSFTLNRSGDPATEIVLDAALDAPGAVYSLGGDSLTNMFVSNAAGGLDVQMNSLRPSGNSIDNSGPNDELRMDITGATVNADLTATPNNIITFDGSDRFAGENPAASNTYDVTTEGIKTGIDMEPVGPNYTRTMIGNTLNVIGSMPQDVLTIHILMDTTGAAYQTTLDGSELRGQLNVAAIDVNLSRTTLQPDLEKVFQDVPFPTDLTVAYSSDNILLKAARSDLNVNLAGTTTYDSIILFEPPQDYAPSNMFPDVDGFLDIAASIERNVANAPNFFSGFNLDEEATFHWKFIAAASTVTIGDGTLAKIQGNVSVNDASVTIDDHQGTDSNIIQMTSSSVTGWATPSNSHPTLTIGQVFDAFTFHASNTDRFNIVGTPSHWWELNLSTIVPNIPFDGVDLPIAVSQDGTQMTIRNSTYDDSLFFKNDRNVIDNPGTGATSDIYITGKDMMPMSITGNFNLYAGRQLLPNGTVIEGTVDNIIKPITNSPFGRQQPIDFTYTGPGAGTAVWDASQDIYNNALFASVGGKGFYGVFASPLNPGLATLYYLDGDYVNLTVRSNDQFGTFISGEEDLRGQFVYGPNTDLTFDAPQIPTDRDLEAVFDNPISSTIHYYSNPLDGTLVQEEVAIYQSVGTVDVHGTPGDTDVMLTPPRGIDPIVVDDGVEGTINVVPYLSNEQYLTNSVLGDVYVTNAAIQIDADNGGTVAPPVLSSVVVTQTEVTGLTSGIIHMLNLADMVESPNSSSSIAELGTQAAGLYIDLPDYGTIGTTVEDTPPGVITAFDESTFLSRQPNPVTVLATTGGLAFTTHYNGPTITFGNGGTLDTFHGNVFISNTVADVAKVFDGHLDSPRTVTSAPLPFGQTEVSAAFEEKISGLMPANIYLTTDITHLDIDGGAGDVFNITYAGTGTPEWRLFAGPQTTVNVLPVPFPTPGLEIYGAQNVFVQILTDIMGMESGIPLKVFKSPDRPNDPINLSIDLSGATNQTTLINGLILERLNNTQGDLRATGNPAIIVDFPSDVTNLTVKSSTSSQISTITVNDTPAANTIIDPAHATLTVNATSGPLTILQGTVANQVTIGSTGNMQSIAGAITISAGDSTRPTVPVRLNDASDTVGRTAVFSYLSGVPQVAGLAPAAIIFSGTLFMVTIAGGSGSNTLAGPDGANNWQLTGAQRRRTQLDVHLFEIRQLEGRIRHRRFLLLVEQQHRFG